MLIPALVTLSNESGGPHSNVTCPLTSLNCTAVDIPGSVLRWFFDEDDAITYLFRPDDQYPLQLSAPSCLSGVMMVQIMNAFRNGSTFHFISIMSANVSALVNAGVTEISCGDFFPRSNHVPISKSSPPPPPADCSLLPSPGGAEISLQWSPSFTSQYAVERYRVSVNSDPSSCSSDQVSPSEDYNCSGLVLGIYYTFTVSAINCGERGISLLHWHKVRYHICQSDSPGLLPILMVCPGIQGLPYFVQGHATEIVCLCM